MVTIKKLGTKLLAAINFIFGIVEYAARLALLVGIIMYIISLFVQSKVLETYALSVLIGAALYMIPALVFDIEYNTKQAHYHLERLDYMMYHGVYEKNK